MNKLAQHEKAMADWDRHKRLQDVLERVDKVDPNRLAELFVAGCIGFVIGCVVVLVGMELMTTYWG